MMPPMDLHKEGPNLSQFCQALFSLGDSTHLAKVASSLRAWFVFLVSDAAA